MNKPSNEKLHGRQRLSASQRAALEWLNDHGGDGAFVRGGTLRREATSSMT